MPGSYPPAAPSISGDFITISRFLNSPQKIGSRLQELPDIGFVADQILTQKFRTSGGAVSYEVSEPIFNTRAVTAVAPGAEYPMDSPATGLAALASVNKWGEKTRLTDERIKRTMPMGGAVDWALRKTTNTITQKVDRLALAAIASLVTATSAAIAVWTSLSTAQMLRDIEVARGVVDDLEMGYDLDTLLMSNTKYALLLSDDKIATLRRREATDNPVYGGNIEEVAGLKIVRTKLANMPGGTDDVWLIDSKNLGGMADEVEVDPGYAVGPNGIQVKSIRKDDVDAWDLQARRITVPVVQEPGAAIRITGS